MFDQVSALVREGDKTLKDAQDAIALAKKDIPKIATALWLFIILQALSLMTTVGLLTYVVLGAR